MKFLRWIWNKVNIWKDLEYDGQFDMWFTKAEFDAYYKGEKQCPK